MAIQTTVNFQKHALSINSLYQLYHITVHVLIFLHVYTWCTGCLYGEAKVAKKMLFESTRVILHQFRHAAVLGFVDNLCASYEQLKSFNSL